MSLTVAQSLQSLALAQALMVAPDLGDTYAGKTAATIAALLIILSGTIEELPAHRLRSRQRLLKLLASANVGDVTLSRDLDIVLGKYGSDDSGSWSEGDAVLMATLTEVHAWADSHDAALAGRCRDWLADWSAGERLLPPALPG